MPHLAALDFKADDAGTPDGDDEVDLVIFPVVGDPLADDDQVAFAELRDEQAKNPAFGVVGQSRFGGQRDRHACPLSARRACLPVSTAAAILEGADQRWHDRTARR